MPVPAFAETIHMVIQFQILLPQFSQGRPRHWPKLSTSDTALLVLSIHPSKCAKPAPRRESEGLSNLVDPDFILCAQVMRYRDLLIRLVTMLHMKMFCRGFIPSVRNRSIARTFIRPSLNLQFPQRSLWAMSDENGKDPQTSWEYKPYAPPAPQKRKFSEWKVPKTITIPEDRLELSFVRSSGAGGQNVNKVNTKVEVRFHVMDADWIPEEVRTRLMEQQSNRINKDGLMTLSSQDYRTQQQNRKAVLSKLQNLILKAYPRPKERKMRKGISKASKERNKEQKKRRSDVKANRRRVDF